MRAASSQWSRKAVNAGRPSAKAGACVAVEISWMQSHGLQNARVMADYGAVQLQLSV
jgi:hypothetical protein